MFILLRLDYRRLPYAASGLDSSETTKVNTLPTCMPRTMTTFAAFLVVLAHSLKNLRFSETEPEPEKRPQKRPFELSKLSLEINL